MAQRIAIGVTRKGSTLEGLKKFICILCATDYFACDPEAAIHKLF